MNSAIHYRIATEHDRDGIGGVLAACYAIDNARAGAAVFMHERSAGHSYIAAVADNAIIGIVAWVYHGLTHHGLCELDRIAVLQQYRGHNISRALYDHLVRNVSAYYQAHGHAVRKLYLLTHESNKRAHAFYEKLGFTHETTLRDHYYAGENERLYSVFFPVS